MPGAIEYQGLHSDNMWTEPFDPSGGVTIASCPCLSVTINFPMVDLTPENGPIDRFRGRTARGTRSRTSLDEPEWMKLSTVCPAAGRLGAFSATLRTGTAARPICRATCGRCRTSSTSRRGSAARRLSARCRMRTGRRCRRTPSGSAATWCATRARRWSARASAIPALRRAKRSAPAQLEALGEQAATEYLRRS